MLNAAKSTAYPHAASVRVCVCVRQEGTEGRVRRSFAGLAVERVRGRRCAGKALGAADADAVPRLPAFPTTGPACCDIDEEVVQWKIGHTQRSTKGHPTRHVVLQNGSQRYWQVEIHVPTDREWNESHPNEPHKTFPTTARQSASLP